MRPYLLLGLLLLAVFGPAISVPFHFDDLSIFSDPAVLSDSGWREVWQPQRTRPLTYLTFWLDYQVAGEQAARWYHGVNVALHASVVMLLFGMLRKLLPEESAWLAAAMFAIHPLQMEAVVLVFSRAILLAVLLCVLALRFWLRGRQWVAVALFGLALLAKEECVMLPLVLMLWRWRGGGRREEGSANSSRQEWAALAAMLALSAAAGLRTLAAAAMTPGSRAGTQAGISWWEYFIAQGGAVIWRYLRLLVLPWGFTVHPEVHVPPVWLGLAGWAALAGLCLLLLRFSPLRGGATSSGWALSGGAWFTSAMILLLASSSVFPAGDLAADRRMYLPMLGFAPAAALLLLRRVPRRREFGVGAVAVLAVLSAIRVQVWRSPEALWSEAVERAPDKVLPRIQLSRALAPTDAIAVLQEARRLDPESPAVAEELGRVYLETGQPALALGEFGRVLAARANDPKALNHRGLALLALGQTAAAQRDFYAALSVDPCLFAAHLNLRQTGARPPASNGCRFSLEQAQALQE